MRILAAFLLCLAAAVSPRAAQDAGTPSRQASRERTVTSVAIPGVVAAGVQWTRLWQGTDNADGLVGTPDGGVLFAQEQPSRVRKIDAKGRVSVYVENTKGTGSLALDAAGRLFGVQRTCTDPGLNAPCAEPTAIAIIHPVAAKRVVAGGDRSLGRLNDLVVSRQGAVYFTSGAAYIARPDGQVVQIGEEFRTNGIMLSPDEKTLYVTSGARVVAFDVEPDGAVSNQRPFATLQAGGSGDGMAVDADGRLYVTSQQAGVQVFGRDGAYLGAIPTPRNAISAAFSGPDKRTLYIVGSGAQDGDGREITTPAGVRNNAKTIYTIPMLARGFEGRAK